MYTPIDCNFYDRLEAHATLRKRVRIDYRTEQGEAALLASALIVDLQTRNGAEFMILQDGQEIRLDRLIAVDNVPLPGSC